MMDRNAENLLTGLGFAMLTCNSVLAIHRSKGDAWSVAFVVSAYFALLLLFWFLRLYERAAPNSDRRGELKAGIWSLSTFLTFLTCMFLYKVAAFMPLPVTVVVWAMAASVIIGGFYAFFILHAGNLLTGLGFAMLTCNSVLAIHRSKGDAWSVAFVVSAYFPLVLLFWFLRLYERAAPNSDRRGELKAGIWSLSTFLTFLTCMFLYKVAAFMSLPVALVVWAMAASVIIGGFYAFFILHA